MPLRYLTALAVVVVTIAPAAAQESLEGQIGAGVGLAPEYEGADEYKPIPIVPLSLRYKGYGVQTAGQGLQFDLFGYQFINFGPVIQYRGGRDDVDDPVVDLLPDIDPSVEVGGFVEVNLPFFAPGRDAVTLIGRAIFDVADGHGGYLVTPGVRYSVPIGDDWRINLIAESSYGSKDYNNSFFSVTPVGAAASGLPVFTADSGFKDVTGTFSVSYFVTEHWGLLGVARYGRLIGDAAESPIVDQRGSENQYLGGLALTYRF